MPRGTKRSASPAAPTDSEKRAKIVSALRKNHCPTETSARMLASMVASSLGVYKDERHAHQEETINMIGEALKEHVARMNQNNAEAKVQVDGAGHEKERREAVHAAAVEQEKTDKGRVEQCKAAVSAAKEAVKHADEAVKGAQSMQKSGDKTYKDLAEKKAKVDEAQAAFTKVSATKADARSLKLIKGVGNEFKMDSTMLTSLPLALNKDQSARSQFDAVIVQQFADALTKELAKQQEAVNAEEPGRAARQASVDAAKAARDAAAAGLADCEAKLKEARDAEHTTHEAIKSAKKAVSNYIDDMKVIMDGFDQGKNDLAAFQEEIVGLFNELKDRVAPPPEPEASADAPMADAAQEGAPAAM